MYNSNLEDLLKNKIDKIHQNIVFAKLEKNELENQLEYLLTYRGNVHNITLIEEHDILNTPDYLLWKNQKLLKLQEKYNNLLSEKQKSDEKCRILQHANDMLYTENNNLKNEIVDINNNATII